MASDSLIEQIQGRLHEVNDLYYQLILVVSPDQAEISTALHTLAQHRGLAYMNVSRELSLRLLNLTTDQRVRKTGGLMSDLIKAASGHTIILDNTALLFEVTLRQDPLRLLQRLSRHKTILAAWNGRLLDHSLVYAEPDHAEYRRYAAKDIEAIAITP